jgi:two-component system sensor histidine kinase KdpD
MDSTSQRTEPGGALLPVLKAVGIVAATGGLAALARALLHVQDVEMIFLLGVMATALVAGRTAALLAAVLAVGVFDWFFVPPYYTLDVTDSRYITTFATMFVISVVIGTLVLRLREQREDALQRAHRARVLHAASRKLAGALDLDAISLIICRGAAEALLAEAAWFDVLDGGAVAPRAAEPPGSALRESAAELAESVAAHGAAAGTGTRWMAAEPSLCAPVHALEGVAAVVGVQPLRRTFLSPDQRELVESLAQSAALALDRVRHVDEARRAALEVEREALRSQLLASVSHDLRTPLATITGSASALREDSGLDERTRADLTDSIVDEAERLERLVGNLLDMTRLERGAVTPRREWVPADEVVGSALTRAERALAGREVHTSLSDDLPLLSADPVLLEQLFVNLLENAAKYTPPGSAVEVSGRREGDVLRFEVTDHGPGIAAGEEERIFERFQRGSQSGPRGAGLGLSIARAIATVHGGRLVAENRPGGGAAFTLTLPVPAGAPAATGAEAGGRV